MNKTILYKALFLSLGGILLNQSLLATNIYPKTSLPSSKAVAIDSVQDNIVLPDENTPILGKRPLKLAKAGASSTPPPINQESPDESANTKKIDCNYKITSNTPKVDKGLVLSWAENAVQQSFDLDSNAIEQQLIELKSCFTDQGWESFGAQCSYHRASVSAGIHDTS